MFCRRIYFRGRDVSRSCYNGLFIVRVASDGFAWDDMSLAEVPLIACHQTQAIEAENPLWLQLLHQVVAAFLVCAHR